MSFRALVLTCIAAATSACAPLEYGAISATPSRPFGYSDQPTSPGSHTVRVVLPETAGPALAFEWWDRRAREICGHDQYRKTMYRAERPAVHYDNYGARPGGYILEGYVKCDVAAPAGEAQPAPTTEAQAAPVEPQPAQIAPATNP